MGERGDGELGEGSDNDFNGGQYEFQDEEPDGSQISKDDIMTTQQGV